MKIKWFGHSCFLIISESGVRILMDPFNEKVGYEVPAVEADIVTTSHDHYDHNYVEAVRGDFKHIRTPGSHSEHGIKIIGISTYHDKEKGAKRGTNIVFKYTVDRLNICHLGDLGHILTKEQIEDLGGVDILLLPIGGTYTIDHYEAVELMDLINPRLVIPMHYKTPDSNIDIDPLDKFLNHMSEYSETDANEVEIKASQLESMDPLLVLNYK